MLAFLSSRSAQHAPLACPDEDGVVSGLNEDVDYVISWQTRAAGDRIFVDDVELSASSDGSFGWRPAFYAGRVPIELVRSTGELSRYWLDVGPSTHKSGKECFAEMVREIRECDPALLLGESAAGIVFGREGTLGLFSDDVLLSRVRTYGPSFLAAVMEIAKVPHRALSADTQNLPLVRIRRLHPSALRDRRLLTVLRHKSHDWEGIEALEVQSFTVEPTFDTPANRTLLALLRRMLAVVRRLQSVVWECGLRATREEQELRRERRLAELGTLEVRLTRLMRALPFSEVKTAQTSAAGLTQISAQPLYSRAYRAGSNALRTGVEGQDQADLLHVTPSWGIYETWCYLATLRAVSKATGVQAQCCRASLLPCQLTHKFDLGGGKFLLTFFQAIFPSHAPGMGRRGYSISRERRPDIVLVHSSPDVHRAMVLDAKWRSGRDRVLESMESVHIYHDALRVDGRIPNPCLILLPGAAQVPPLETAEFVEQHGVGALSEFAVGLPGCDRLAAHIGRWLIGEAS